MKLSRGRAFIGSLLSGKNSLEKKLKETVNKWTDELNQKIADEYRELFGNTPMWSDWVDNPVKAAKIAENRRSRSQKARNSRFFKQYSTNIQKIYTQYWKERYNEIKKLYPWHPNDSSNYKKSNPYKKHYRYKVRNYGSGSRHNGKPIKYVSPALMTGFLKMSIAQAIKKDGNEYLEIFNDPLAVGFIFRPENYPTPKGGNMSYVEYFWNRASNGGDPQEIFNLPDEYWRRISAELDILVRDGIIPSFNIAARNT